MKLFYNVKDVKKEMNSEPGQEWSLGTHSDQLAGWPYTPYLNFWRNSLCGINDSPYVLSQGGLICKVAFSFEFKNIMHISGNIIRR